MPEISIFDKKRGIKFPKRIDARVAELLGIMLGDGSINKYFAKGRTATDYVISVTGNADKDRDYLVTFVSPLFYNLFGIKPKFFERSDQKTIFLLLRSKGVFEYLKGIGLNIGRKDNIEIPKCILKRRELIIPLIRGLFDTDGSVAIKTERNYPVISLKLKSRQLIAQVDEILRNIGFVLYTEYDVKTFDKRGFTSVGSRVYISGRKNLEIWMRKIGFTNKRNLSKVEKIMGREGISVTKQKLRSF